MPSPLLPPVVVVGAGLAGLTAAWRLRAAGVEVLVLEARSRVGGRTWSQELGDGTVVERGGEFIAPDDHDLRDLCAELGLQLVPHGFSFDRRPTPGRPAPTEAELAAVMASARERIAARLDGGDDDAPAAAAFPEAGRRTPVERQVIGRLETSLSVPLSMVSGRRLLAAEGHGYDPADRVLGGNQRVAIELARRLQPAVRLDTAVAAVEHDALGAAVRCQDGEVVRATAVVLALPLPLLLGLELRPGLPEAVEALARRTPFGDAAKLHVPLARGTVPGGMAAPDALWWAWTSQAPGGSQSSPMLSCFAGGAAAVAQLAGATSWAAQAAALRPDAEPAGDPLVTHWGADPWARGSYSAHGIGSTPEDDDTWAAGAGRVVLAGEHTAGDRSGTMNGAVASGARAASTVLRSAL